MAAVASPSESYLALSGSFRSARFGAKWTLDEGPSRLIDRIRARGARMLGENDYLEASRGGLWSTHYEAEACPIPDIDRTMPYKALID